MTDAVTGTTALFGKGFNMLKDAMAPPEPPKPKIAPVADDAAKRAAAARKAERKYAGTGRAGTMLTGQGDKLG